MMRFLEKCIENSRAEEEFFFSDLQAQFQRNTFLEFIFSPEVMDSLFRIFETLRKKLLITFDGFDSMFDTFRRNSLFKVSELESKAKFELDLLRSFVQIVLRIKRLGKTYGSMSDRIEFCVTVPQDRFLEVIETERDSYQYQNRFCELKWSGIELAIALRKRLEELVQTSTDRRKRPEERLEAVMRESFRNIPLNITFDFNGHQYTMPLFMYVLRHTFWRPRDILLYYAQIITVAETIRHKGEQVSSEIIQHIIKDVTKTIINSEFINEFESTIVNIKEIIMAFKGAKELIDYDEVGNRVNGIDFKFAIGVGNVHLDSKIALLYRMGFLGMLANDKLCSQLNLKNPHAFYFNEGDIPISLPHLNDFREYTFIIHPVFSEYLELDTSGSELMLQFSWKYLHEMEALLS